MFVFVSMSVGTWTRESTCVYVLFRIYLLPFISDPADTGLVSQQVSINCLDRKGSVGSVGSVGNIGRHREHNQLPDIFL